MNVNTNRMVELALVFFVSLLSFSIGTFVGKKYSDNQHRLAKLEPHGEKAQELVKEQHDAEVTGHNEPKIVEQKAQETLTDHEVAQMAKEFSDEEIVPDSKDIEETVAEVSLRTTKTLKKLAALKAKDVKEISGDYSTGKDIVRDVASITAKVKKAAVPENFWYTVQVAAYPSADEADKMVSTLGARGYKGRSVEADVNGRKWYRVQVGNFENFKDADTYKKEIMEQNRLASALVQKIAKAAAAPAVAPAPTPHAPASTAPSTPAPAEQH